MAGDLDVLAGLNISASTNQIKKDLKTISDKLKEAEVPKFIGSLNITRTTAQFKKDLKTISKGLTFDVKANLVPNKAQEAGKGAIPSLAGQIFKTSDLDKAGIKYYKQVNDIVSRVQKEYSKLGDKVDVQLFNNAKGQVESFVVTLNKAGNVIEKFNFQRAKLDTGSNKMAGFVQESSALNNKMSGTELQKTIAFLNQVEKQLDRINNGALNKANPLKPDTQFYNDYISKLNETRTRIDAIKNSNKILSFEQRESIKKMIFDLDQYTARQKYAANVPMVSSQGVDSSKKIAIAQLTVMENKYKNVSQSTKELQVQYDGLRNKLLQLRPLLNSVADDKSFQNYMTQFKTLKTEFAGFETTVRTGRAVDNVAQRAAVLAQRINTYIATNSNATRIYGENLRALANQASNAQTAFDVTKTSRQFQILTNQIKATGSAGNDLLTMIVSMGKKFAQWFGVSQAIMKTIQLIRQTVTNVKELDTAMVSLKKVTNETDVAYNNCFEKMAKDAQNLNAKLNDMIIQTSTFAKLGYNLSDASALAKISTVYANVGELDNEQAVTNIITSLKTFYSETDNVEEAATHIIDSYNKIGNEFAVSSGNLGSGMAQAAATMSLAGNDFNHSLALLTGAGEILGDDKLEEIGSGVRVLTLRLQNQLGKLQEINEEYEDLESVSKTQTQIYNLTKGTVNIMQDADPTKFKETYQILEEISKVFDSLEDTKKAELTQVLFGKQRANVGSGIIKAFQSGQVQKAFQAAENSAGSAMKEQERWADSIEAKTNKVASQFEYLSSVLVNSEGLKSTLDIINDLMGGFTKLVENFGAGNLAFGILAASMISHFGKFGNMLTFNGNSLSFLGKQYNLFNKNLFQTGQAMNYSMGNVKSLSNAIKLYNQDTAAAVKFQQNMRDSIPTSYTQAYIQSLNGAKASLSGYTNFLADSVYKTQGASGAIQTYNTLLKQSPEAAGLFAKSMIALNPSLANFMLASDGAARSVQTFTIKATVAKAASIGLSVGINILKAAAMSAFSLGIGLLVKELANYITTSKEALSKANELSQTFKQQQDTLKDLRDQYAEILQSTDDDAAKKERLKNIVSQLDKEYDFEAEKLNTINQLRQEGLDLMDEESRKRKYEYLADNSEEYKKAISDIEKSVSKEQKIINGVSNVRSEIRNLFTVETQDYVAPTGTAALKSILAPSTIGTRDYYSVEGTDAFDTINKLKNIREEMQKIQISGKGFSESEEKLYTAVDKAYTKALDKNKERIILVEDWAKNSADVILEEYSKVNKSFSEVYTTKGYDDWYTGLTYKIKGVTNDLGLESVPVQNAMNELLDSLKTMRESNPIEIISDLDEALKMLQDSQSNFDKLSESIKTASDSLQDLNQVVKDNESTDKFFSSQEIIELLEKYPELSNAIKQTAYGYKIEQSALENLKKAKLDEQKTALQAQLEESKSALANAKTRLSAYAQEFKGIQTVAAAKAKLAQMELQYNQITAKTSAMQKSDVLNRFTGISGFAQMVTGGYNSKKTDLESYIQAMQNVDSYQGTIDKLQTQISVLGTSFEDIKDDTGDTTDNLDKQKDTVKDMQDSMKEAQEQINDLVDLTVDMLKKQKELEKDVLDAQLDGFKKVISKKKELIDLEKEQYDFQKDVAEKNKSVSDIQNEINLLSLDDSLEGKKKTAELNADLAEEKQKLDDFLYENEVDQRKKALDTEEELFENKINDQLKIIEDYLSKDAQIRRDATDLINSKTQQFYDDLNRYTQTYTEMSEYEFNKLWNSAYDALNKYGGGQIDVLNVLAYLDQQLAVTDWQLKQIENSTNSVKQSLSDMAYTAVSGVNELNNSLDNVGNKMNEINRIPLPRWDWSNPLAMSDYIFKLKEVRDGSEHKYWTTPDLNYSSLKKWHGGGIVGNNTSRGGEILAKMLNGEVVSTENQAEMFVSKTLPNLFNGAINLSNNNSPQSPPVNININVEGNADETTINKLKSVIKGVVKDTFGEINNSKRKFGSMPNTVGY